MFQKHCTTENKQGRESVVSIFDTNERKAVKQGKFSMSLFYSPDYKCLRGPNLSTWKVTLNLGKIQLMERSFYKIVPPKWYDSHWAIHWICSEKQLISFQAFVLLGWERASIRHIKHHCRETKMGDWKDFLIWQRILYLVVYKPCGLTNENKQ